MSDTYVFTPQQAALIRFVFDRCHRIIARERPEMVDEMADLVDELEVQREQNGLITLDHEDEDQ